MKIFKIKSNGETDWVTADDLLSCLKFYLNEVGSAYIDEIDSIDEVPESEWDNNAIRFEDETENGTFYMTFREYVTPSIEPMIISSTAY